MSREKLIITHLSLFIPNSTMQNYDKLHESFYAEWQQLWFNFINEFAYSKNNKSLLKYDLPIIFKNKHVTLDFINKHPNITYHYEYLSGNPNMTMDFILNHLDNKWDWRIISTHPNITMEHVLNNPNLPWNPDELGANPNVMVAHVLENPQIAWNIDVIMSYNKNLTTDFITEHYDRIISNIATGLYDDEDELPSILWNPSITMDFILENPTYKWNFRLMCDGKNITMELVKQYPTIPWNWCYLASNSNFTLEQILENVDMTWCGGIGRNKNLTTDFILEHPNINWKYMSIGDNPNITTQFMLEHSEIEECYIYERNEQQPTAKWALPFTSANPNLSMEFVMNNPDLPWYFNGLVENTFDTDCNAHIMNKMNWLFLTTIHEQINTNTSQHFTQLEQILFDDYMLKMIVKY